MKIATTKERILQFIEYKHISKTLFFKKTGIKRGFLDSDKLNQAVSDDHFAKIIASFSDISIEWLLTGKGEMLRTAEEGNVKFIEATEQTNKKNLIPFYDDVSSVGGVNSISASVDGCMPPSEYIDAGDWFPEATAAIRHYGESMVEYPSGSILALKRVEDLRLIIWGRNYVIETSEFRITKRLQNGDANTIIAYSSNTDTYPDGHLIHEPIPIPKETIRNIDLVLGCVTKEYSSGIVYIKK